MTDNTQIQPIPTEYGGVLFRSKSEAIFARNLDLLHGIWEYEPERLRVNDWCPDFLLHARFAKHMLGFFIIEYKPTLPTDAYFAHARKRFADLDSATGKMLWSGIIACGSAFNRIRHSFAIDNDRWVDKEDTLNLFRFIETASRFRFDLKH